VIKSFIGDVGVEVSTVLELLALGNVGEAGGDYLSGAVLEYRLVKLARHFS
jgi:hypothetical protein